jgi:hypothetical protein
MEMPMSDLDIFGDFDMGGRAPSTLLTADCTHIDGKEIDCAIPHGSPAEKTWELSTVCFSHTSRRLPRRSPV